MNTPIHHLMRKEWLKLRPYYWFILSVNGLAMGYLFLDIRHLFQIEHAEMLYYQANRIGRVFYSDMQYLPLLTGVAISIAQFVPEVSKGRLRLSMHLPISLTVLSLSYLVIGLGVLALILAMDAMVLYVTISTYFPREFAASALGTALPWLIAGVIAYLGTTMTMLEPRRIRQVFNLVISVGLVWLCHMTVSFGAYDQAIWGLVFVTVLLVPASFLPLYRFRDGGL